MRYSFIGYLIAALLTVPAVCRADTAYWTCYFDTGSNSDGGAAATCGVRPTTSDDYDPPSLDPYDPSDQAIGGQSSAYAATYHDHESDDSKRTGADGFYWIDYRAPLDLSPGTSKTWRMYVWAVWDSPMTSMMFAWASPDIVSLRQLSFSLTLVSRPAGVGGGPAVGDSWNLSKQPTGIVGLPIYRTDNPFEGYVFDFTATVIPEPSSLLALLAGIVSSSAYARRKRR